jgi:pimeloyl-ACP methyl ester carboxylesterase
VGAFHLVVHDVGGPIGFDLIRRIPHRISSLTVLNTFAEVSKFRKPLVMRPFEKPLLGRMMVIQMNSPLVVPFFRWKGSNRGPRYSEIRVYGELLDRGDGGRAFLQMMRSFETTTEFEHRILGPLRNRSFPAQIIWGRDDPALRHETFGQQVRNALGLDCEVQLVGGKHFLQENSPVDIADRVALLVEAGHDR